MNPENTVPIPPQEGWEAHWPGWYLKDIHVCGPMEDEAWFTKGGDHGDHRVGVDVSGYIGVEGRPYYEVCLVDRSSPGWFPLFIYTTADPILAAEAVSCFMKVQTLPEKSLKCICRYHGLVEAPLVDLSE